MLRIAVGVGLVNGVTSASLANENPPPAQSAAGATPTPSVSKTPSSQEPAAIEEVDVWADRVSDFGQTVIQRDQLTRQIGIDGDLNKFLQTLPNVQFSDSDGHVAMGTVTDLRPSLISISGGRYYDNSFVVDGLRTNSVQDSSNQNIHSSSETVGHPQTVVVNPKLVESLTVYSHDVPAEFGGFTGGVVSARLRDPSGHFGGGLSVGYESSDMARYHIAPANVSSANPAEPEFSRENYDLYLDSPTFADTAMLLSWSRNSATLANTTRYATFGNIKAETRTVSDNVSLKAVHRLSPETKLRLSTLWSPYETQNREQDLKISTNDGWTNKIDFEHITATSSLEGGAGLVIADNDRQSPSNLYTYRNFGAGDLVNWVADSQATGIRGGVGNLEALQRDLPLNLKYTVSFSDTRKLSVGADYVYTQAENNRPVDVYAYRHQSTVGLVINPLVRSGDGDNDPTVLTGEQALNYRISYPAYHAKVEMQSTDLWAQWQDAGKVLNLPWTYRLGLRHDYNDFLGNHDLAPRLAASLAPLPWLTFTAGANRYYAQANVAYKLRDAQPNSIISTRTYRSEDGYRVYYDADWRQSSISRSARYGSSNLDTPYSDELSLGTQLSLGRFGQFTVTGLDRRNRDEFTRSPASSVVIDGLTYTSYTMTNDGFTNYRSVSAAWNHNWRNHRFNIGGTWSETETSTAELFDEDTNEAYNETVHYNGSLVTRSDVALLRANFARPLYYTFNWSSNWFSDRLSVDLFGRWMPSYDRIDESGTITISGTRYDNYVETKIPATLITNVNVAWQAWKTRRGTLSIEARVSNVLDRLPYAEGATPAAPYQKGRALWLGTSYTF